MSQPNPLHTALVLSGGGAYGAYEVGVMKALCQGKSPATGHTPLDAHILTGTSVGGFNASAMVMQPGADPASAVRRLEEIWLQDIADDPARGGNGVLRIRGNPFPFTNPEFLAAKPADPFLSMARDAVFFAGYGLSRTAGFFLTSGRFSNRVLELIDLSAFISVEPFRDMIDKTISFEGIRRSDKLLRVIATNWKTGAARVFENKDMDADAGRHILMASAAIPGIFSPVDVSGESYVDGGVVMNTPLRFAIDAGATELHVIYLDPDIKRIPLRRLQATFDTFDRVFAIVLATKMNEDIATALWINQGIEAVEQSSDGDLSDAQLSAFLRVAGKIRQRLEQGHPYRKLTIHRYHPRDELGGALGLLDFKRQELVRMIELGYEDAAHHDCDRSECIRSAASSSA